MSARMIARGLLTFVARSALAPRFADLSEQDRGASGAFVVHRLPL